MHMTCLDESGNNNSLDDGLSAPLGTDFSVRPRGLSCKKRYRLPVRASASVSPTNGGRRAYIDFQELKSRVSIEQAIQLLGLRLKPSYDQLRGPCPTCKFGGDRVLAVSPSKSMFYCHAGLTGGDQIALVAHVKACKTNEAAAFLNSTSTSAGSVQNS